MPKCIKNKTMETKTCGIPCYECEYYDKRTAKERADEKADEYEKQKAIDLEEYDPVDCLHCKYFDCGTHGWQSSCLMANKGFVKYVNQPRLERKDLCPLKKYRSRING